jgi:outer membrane protein TolC
VDCPFLRAVAVLLLTGVCLSPAGAQTAPDTLALSLPDLLTAAWVHNPSLRAVRLNATALVRHQRHFSALPEPEASVSYMPGFVDAAFMPRSQWQVMQEVPYPGKRALRGEVAHLDAQMAGLDAQAMEQDVVLALQRAYLDLYGLQEQQRLVATFREDLRAFAEAAAVRYEVGQEAQQAVLRVQLEQHALARTALALEVQQQEALNQLARLTGRPDLAAATAVRLRPPPPIPLPAVLPDTLPTQRPEVQARRVARERARREVAMARRDFYPDFMLGLGVVDMPAMTFGTHDGGSDATAFRERAHVGLMVEAGVRLPLWRNRLRANVEAAELHQAQAEAEEEALHADLRAELLTLRQQHTLALRTLALYETTLLPQAEATREAALVAYTNGQAGFGELLEAERMRFDLYREAVVARTGLWQTEATLARAFNLVPSLATPHLH